VHTANENQKKEKRKKKKEKRKKEKAKNVGPRVVVLRAKNRLS
jgi:hypothetical protein